MPKRSTPKQQALFEEGYLVRTVGSIARDPAVALTELVANAWDAGARVVDVIVPDTYDGTLSVSDDGTGMTEAQFRQRWMTLGYNRLKHQGPLVEFPPGRPPAKREAYGRNGVGRHGMLCFADDYEVTTWRDGVENRFLLRAASGDAPMALGAAGHRPREGHGTQLRAIVKRNLPGADRVRAILAQHFMYDPEFSVSVNGRTLPHGHQAKEVARSEVEFCGRKASIVGFEAEDSGRTAMQHGIAVWVGKKLVGRPGWSLGTHTVLDGRLRAAKRITFVVESNEMADEVLADWSGFKEAAVVDEFHRVVADEVVRLLRANLGAKIDESVASVIEDRADKVIALSPLARADVQAFTKRVLVTEPLIDHALLGAAVDALINLEDTRSGAALLRKIAGFTAGDVDGLNRLLDEWTIRDALSVLDEIGRRLRVVEAITKLEADKTVDELHTLHPLVCQARWLFGPDFEASGYVYNQTLDKGIQAVLGERIEGTFFLNGRKRPDLLLLDTGVLHAVATEDVPTDGVSRLERILLLEFKRGGSEIGRKEMQQAEEYVEELMNCGLLDGKPKIQAYVIGHRRDVARSSSRGIGDDKDRVRVEAVTYSQLARTADARLMRLRFQLEEWYVEGPDDSDVQALLAAGESQVALPFASRRRKPTARAE